MPYAPQTWVDGTTPVDNAHMAHIEAGLGVADANASAALARVQVPAVVNGQWVKGVGGAAVWTPITAGDITGAVNGQFLKGVGGVGAWAALAPADSGLPKITSGTIAAGPPPAPADGDIWIATAVDAAGVVWQFRYNAGSASPYKWEFIGGPPWQGSAAPIAIINTQTQIGSTGFYHAAGDALTTPRAGDWLFHSFVRMQTTSAAAVIAGQPFSGATIGGMGGTEFTLAVAADNEMTVSAPDKLASIAAGVLIGFAWSSSVPATTTLVLTRNFIIPVRVS